MRSALLLDFEDSETLRVLSQPWSGRLKYVSAKAEDRLSLANETSERRKIDEHASQRIVFNDPAHTVYRGRGHRSDVYIPRSGAGKAGPADVRRVRDQAFPSRRPRRSDKTAGRWRWVFGAEHV